MTNDKLKQALLATYCAINSIDDFHKGVVTLSVTASTRNGIEGCEYYASIQPVHGASSSPPTVRSGAYVNRTEREALISLASRLSMQYNEIVRRITEQNALIDAEAKS